MSAVFGCAHKESRLPTTSAGYPCGIVQRKDGGLNLFSFPTVFFPSSWWEQVPNPTDKTLVSL